MNIEELILAGTELNTLFEILKEKTISVPRWGGVNGLESEYDPRMHPVMNKSKYPDLVTSEGVQAVTRVAFDFQRLATKRLSELVCGIPVKRVYAPRNEKQKEVADFMECVYERNRIDSVNVERTNMLFAGCEVLTLWYALVEENSLYGQKSKLKLRCKNFTPMKGEEIYPLFDEYGDLIAMSIGYSRKQGGKLVEYLDTYTANLHIKWNNASGEWEEVERDKITLGKIPAVYAYRPTPCWEHTSNAVYEMEWAISRSGNYLRENSKPLFVVFADESIAYGDEKSPNREFKAVAQFPKGSTAQYVTWEQSTEALKYHIEQLRTMFFTQLQLPDWSYERMSQQALSGESRKQMFIDAQLKVKDESGRLAEFFDREANVIKAFIKLIFGESYHADIEELAIEHIITPYTITDEADTIDNLLKANGNEPLISHKESIELYGHSKNVDETLKEIAAQKMVDVFRPEASR